MDKEITIHIEWDGPFVMEGTGRQIAKLKHPKKDKGVYQIYGGNSIYGGRSLLYIGLTANQSFAHRIAKQEWRQIWKWNRDAGRIEVYVGRLSGHETPKTSIWNQHISFVERLLIYSHQPPLNTQKNFRTADGLKGIHVLNWGKYRDLLPEVSGARWTPRYDKVKDYHQFGDEHKL